MAAHVHENDDVKVLRGAIDEQALASGQDRFYGVFG